MHVPRKCLGNRGLGQRVTKNVASGIAHLAKLRFAVGGHGKDYNDQPSVFSVQPSAQFKHSEEFASGPAMWN
jgi:hypothetical protein